MDLPSTVLEWAAEAAINDADGYYGGSHNFYLYDEGAKGYTWLPSDDMPDEVDDVLFDAVCDVMLPAGV